MNSLENKKIRRRYDNSEIRQIMRRYRTDEAGSKNYQQGYEKAVGKKS